MEYPSPDAGASTRIRCAETGRSGGDAGVRTYEWCPFCGGRIAGDAAHELVLTVPDRRVR